MRLRAVIVDDERLARQRLRELLSVHPEIVVADEAEDAAGALAAVEKCRPEVLFLDVELATDNGLDLPPRLNPAPALVFVTAHASFAVRAFTVCAFDYLLKPVHPDRLAQTVRRLRERTPAGRRPQSFGVFPAEPVTLDDRVPLKDGGTLRVVEVGRIAAIQAMGAYTRVLLRDLPPMMVLRGISDWEKVLPAAFFKRLERSLIVQLPLLRAIETVSRDRSELVLQNIPERLAIRRVAAQRLRRESGVGRA